MRDSATHAPRGLTQRSTTLALHGLWLLAGLALGGCQPAGPAGELVGRYEIMGELTENSCGTQALPAIDPLAFVAEIRVDQGRGLWIRGESPPFGGSLEAVGDFRFEIESVYPVNTSAADQRTDDGEYLALLMEIGSTTPPAQGQGQAEPTCRLRVPETVRGNLFATGPEVALDGGLGFSSAEASDSDLTADNDIEILAEPGSDCRPVLAAFGGPFLTLPCGAHYSMQGMLLDTAP